MILDVDLSAIEWCICADMTKDPRMIQDIINGVDPHAYACTEIMELPLTKENRTKAKPLNFRGIFANPETAAFAFYMDVKMPDFSQKKWTLIVENFYNKYSGMVDTHNKWLAEVRRTGQLVGPTGRIWKFQKVLKNGYLDYSVTQPRNYPVQGSSGDLIKLALVLIHKRIAHIPNCLLTMSVHDSIILDVEERYILEVATTCINTFRELPELAKRHFNWSICVPITGEAAYGPSWGEMKPLTV